MKLAGMADWLTRGHLTRGPRRTILCCGQSLQIRRESNTLLQCNTHPTCPISTYTRTRTHELSHAFPLPNPIMYVGIPCALVKLMGKK
jgi:hypothetical protein